MLKRIFTTTLTSFLFVTLSYGSISSTITGYIHRSNPNINVGILIKSLRTGKIIYQRNANRLFIPASNLKILTAEAALLYLGPQYQFVTRLLSSSSRVTRGTLTGDVYLDYSGDPTLSIKNINDMLVQLKKTGVRQIRGDFYLDRYAYDQDNTASGWNKGDLQYCFSAPVNAAIVNRNCLSYVVSPGLRSGYRVQARAANFSQSFIRFDNTAVTRLSRKTCPPLRTGVTSDNTIVVRGCLLRQDKAIGLSNSVMSVKAYNIAMIQSLLRKNDIRLTGQVKSGQVYKGLRLVAYHSSQPLYVLIKTMMKKSDNLYAETIYKKIGQRYFREPGSWKNGGLAVKAILAKEDKVNLDDVIIDGGSGLSHYNLISPAQLVTILTGAYHNFPTNRQFIDALPVAGVDGTLKYRMRQKFMRARVQAKTGTLNGVSTLSGYLKTRRFGTYVFSIMINGYSGGPSQYRRLQDKILTYLAKR